MKKILKTFGVVFFALCYLFMVSACSGVADKGGYGGGYGGAYGEGVYGDATLDKDAALDGVTGGETLPEGGEGVEDGEGVEGGEGEEVLPDESTSEVEPDIIEKPAGLITAGAWNDNDNYEYWKEQFSQEEQSDSEGGTTSVSMGKFYAYSSEDKSWGFNSLYRVKVTVKNGENAVAGAQVVAKDGQGKALFKAVSDASGVAYLFTDERTGTVEIVSGEGKANAEFTAENREITVNLEQNEAKKDIIELMFVVDVTGSMGDELSFLNNEISDVVSRVAAQHANAQIHLALLFYRDYSDKEIFKYHDFVDVTDAEGLAAVKAAIAAQKATGGGDYAEAVEDTLAMATEKQWSDGATTKIIFQVLDAPPHGKASNKENMHAAVMAAAEKGIRVCPVICSGADTLTEYVMRQAAIYTGGTFVFVTDDSGIGNPHYDPNLPNVTVEALNSLMVRLINGYHSGEFAEPIDWRQEVK